MKTKLWYLTTKITVAVVLVAVLVVKAFAGSSPKVSLVPYNSDCAVISVANLSGANSELTIENASGDILYYKEGAIEGAYSKIFDFKNLRDGDYKVVVTNEDGSHELKFTVDGSNVLVPENEEKNAPYFSVKDGVLKLSFLNETNGDVVLKFSNDYGVFYTKSLGSNFSITAGFNLDRLESGDYAVELTSGDKTYSYNFEK